MDKYSRYLQIQTLSKIWEGLSDSDKQILANSCKISKDENESIVNQKLDSIERKIDKNRHSFGFGVLENVTGNAAYEAALWLIKKIVRRF